MFQRSPPYRTRAGLRTLFGTVLAIGFVLGVGGHYNHSPTGWHWQTAMAWAFGSGGSGSGLGGGGVVQATSQAGTYLVCHWSDTRDQFGVSQSLDSPLRGKR